MQSGLNVIYESWVAGLLWTSKVLSILVFRVHHVNIPQGALWD